MYPGTFPILMYSSSTAGRSLLLRFLPYCLTSLPKNAVAERGVLGDQMAVNAGGGRGVMVGRDAFVQVEGGRRWRGRA
jgi:hypothetical protein